MLYSFRVYLFFAYNNRLHSDSFNLCWFFGKKNPDIHKKDVWYKNF